MDVHRAAFEGLAEQAGTILEAFGLASGLAQLGARVAAATPAVPAAGVSAGPRDGGQPADAALHGAGVADGGMAVDQEAGPEDVTEKEKAWLLGEADAPDKDQQSEKHKRYLVVLQVQHAYNHKRQRCG
ncbi:unnamed protein product [Prorocentrum cordatum]|uniref:Uncharacterized protein n=1 Tax=Prorocentrum cordatum TaxID=2364126 RepID=A0ABN9QF14_9DINO|nr:unnamed protein product [Polarella glacialis]